jgi:peptidoglycan/LPS O-acetylase OafA/YrhL
LLPKLGLHTGNGVVLFLVFLVMTWIAAWASWKFIESPINNLKNRIPYIRG